MIDTLKSWIVGISCVAIALAMAESLMPEGTVKKIGRFTGGLALLLTLIQPVVGLDFSALSASLTSYRLAGQSIEASGSEMSNQLMKSIIESQTSAYILDKVEAMGATCTVSVTCQSDESGIPYPQWVTVVGSLTAQQQDTLTWMMEGDLAIPASNQQYISDEGGEVE